MIYKSAVSKKGHGVAIYIDVVEIRNPVVIDTDKSVMNNIFVRVDTPIYFLSEDDIDRYIIKAIKELSSSICNKINESAVCFHIKSVDTNPIHFQEEALYYVMRGWLGQNYGLELPSMNIEFDEDKGKFLFNIQLITLYYGSSPG